MNIDFEKNTVQDGYGTWKILERHNDCYIARGFGNINHNQSAYEIGFRDQHISVMRMLPHHFYDLSISIIEIIKQLPDDSSIPQELKNYKKKLLL
ncbi:MAG: hypothetical protein QCH96_05965 [Candidatus Thermoplasmatota archaeon]|nr:hypothetical protein [Candidatus Thermoplasmatota archaeon]